VTGEAPLRRGANAPSVRDRLGFRGGDRGTHTSRTIMSVEVQHLFAVTPTEASKAEYWRSIIEGNSLGKRTGSTRRLSAQRLAELYGLDPTVPMFRVLRHFWGVAPEGNSLLAFLCAYARDPLLRLTTPAVLDLPVGTPVKTADLEAPLAQALTGRLNPSIINNVARNAGSCWTQSGHLVGRPRKVRSRSIVCIPAGRDEEASTNRLQTLLSAACGEAWSTTSSGATGSTTTT